MARCLLLCSVRILILRACVSSGNVGKAPMPKLLQQKAYYARLDAKKRFILRGAKYDQFKVQPRADGSFVAKPVVSVSPDEVISPATLRCIKKSLASMKAGKRGMPVDLKKLAAMKL